MIDVVGGGEGGKRQEVAAVHELRAGDTHHEDHQPLAFLSSTNAWAPPELQPGQVKASPSHEVPGCCHAVRELYKGHLSLPPSLPRLVTSLVKTLLETSNLSILKVLVAELSLACIRKKTLQVMASSSSSKFYPGQDLLLPHPYRTPEPSGVTKLQVIWTGRLYGGDMSEHPAAGAWSLFYLELSHHCGLGTWC